MRSDGCHLRNDQDSSSLSAMYVVHISSEENGSSSNTRDHASELPAESCARHSGRYLLDGDPRRSRRRSSTTGTRIIGTTAFAPYTPATPSLLHTRPSASIRCAWHPSSSRSLQGQFSKRSSRHNKRRERTMSAAGMLARAASRGFTSAGALGGFRAQDAVA